MENHPSLAKRVLAYALSTSVACTPLTLSAAVTDISDQPVTQPATTSMHPNVLLILDDSGSMARQFTPDYVSSNSNTGTMKQCFDSADSSNNVTTSPEECWPGDPPAFSPDFNVQYYNPEIKYLPAVDYTGVPRDNMTAAVTSNWTAVPTDAVSPSSQDQSRKDMITGVQAGTTSSNWQNGSSGTIDTMDVTTQWPDRVWCIDKGDTSTDPARCKINSSYTYPDFKYAYNTDLNGDFKYVKGAPYYYRISPTEFCTDARMNDCIAVTVATVQSGKNYNVPAPVRFCVDSTLTDCYAKRGSYKLPPANNLAAAQSSWTTRTFNYPKYLGNLTNNATITAGTKGTATITFANPQPDAASGRITQITVTKTLSDGTIQTFNIGDGGNISLGSLNSTSKDPSSASTTWARAVESRIDNNNSSDPVAYPFTASSSGNVVTITSQDAGVDMNGSTITVSTQITGSSGATATITISGTVKHNACSAAGQGCGEASSLLVDGTQFLPAGAWCSNSNCASNTQSTRDNQMAADINSKIVLPSGWSKSVSGAVITITAPGGSSVTTPANAIGSSWNGKSVSLNTSNTSKVISNSGTLQGGVTTGDAMYTTSPFGGGADPAVPGGTRQNVGLFVRVNLLPGQTYNQYPARDDCTTTPGVCTYEEEMTNFGNWFAYYRTRMQMAKTSIGRAVALAGMGDNFRVGFMTINYSSSNFLAVNSFTTGSGGQKDLWYRKLYGAGGTGSTPLIGALTRAGKYLGDINPNSMGHTPINSACQPNYVILTSDGYWNDTDGGAATSVSTQPAKKLDNSGIGDADGDGYPNTLADVAYYYYNTDLLPTTPTSPVLVGFKNQVPPSGIDDAPHQHMTTFTVGMGVSGTLLFDPNYLEPGNSTDYDAIVASGPTSAGGGRGATTGGTYGSSLWPQPVANTESTVDDMWHAAVNGHGKFFSAKDPVALALGINEVLSSVVKRVGAGAAAATSNLQPVAGDNFAYTAQYQTVEWTGDIIARTIDLSTGTVAARQLWSAQTQLDFRLQTDRNIFTYDATDTDPTAVVTVAFANRTQNANKLRSFCRNNQSLGSSPTCSDGALLTTTEQTNYFDPLGGLNGSLIQAGGWPSGDPRRSAASQSSLIRYLRGEISNEMTLGGVTATDLYRNRTHLLGDIVNAQPAYVKSSPFSYTSTTDPFYTDFKNTTNGQSGTRKGTVYVAANDGMLHAFETDPDNNPYYQSAGVATLNDTTDDKFVGTLDTNPVTGEGAERWAYVPQLIFSTMKRLAEDNYSSNHRFFVDGSPAIGDICVGHTTSTPCSAASKWRTILVAGLNKGGRGFYALDVTDPDNPKGLWELTGGSDAPACLTATQANSGTYTGDCNIGYTFGNPIIAKRAEDGRWVVLVTSGYNNVSPGDGLGYLYVIDAATGVILRRMTTNVGSTTSPSGLARINAWVDSAVTNNTALAVYGGDLAGNLWRFQLDNTASVARYSVTKIATVTDGTAARNPQPIMARPELALVSNNRVAYVGTGQFLGDSDKPTTKRQSIYAIKDVMSSTSLSTPTVDMTRGGTDPVYGAPPVFASTITSFKRRTLTEDSTTTRTVATPIVAVNWSTDNGWFIDLPDGADSATSEEAAERVSVDPIIQLGTLVVPSNVPSTETCVAGGSGWVNFLDINQGAIVPGTAAGTPASVKVAGSLIVGINIVKIGDQLKTIVTTADNQQLTKDTPTTPQTVQGRRVTWRELNVE